MKLSITELNKNLSAYIKRSHQEDIIITNYGKDVAVITSLEKYQASQASKEIPSNLAEALAYIGGVDFDWELPEREPWEMKQFF